MNRLAGAFLAGFAGAVIVVGAACNGSGAKDSQPTLTQMAAQPAPPSPALQQMMADVAAVRGLAPPRGFKVALVARAQLPGLLEQLITDDDRRWFAETTTLYRLLGHLRTDQDYLTVYKALTSQSAVGLYSPAKKQLWVVADDQGRFDIGSLSRDAKAALAHELVHAIQDANFPLQDLLKAAHGDLDAALALSCVIEGDAVTHAGLYSAKYLFTPRPGAAAILVAAGQPSEAPPSVSRELLFPYTTGAEWVHLIREAGGSAAVDALLRTPPRTTAEVLHPELARAGWTPEKVQLPDLTGALGAGWKRESGGTFGEFQLRNYLQLRLPGVPAATAAAGWSGDRYDVYSKGTESVAVFRIAFADDAQAGEFNAARESFFKAANARQTARDAWQIAEVTGAGATAWAAAPGREAVFAVASSADLAVRALQLAAGG